MWDWEALPWNVPPERGGSRSKRSKVHPSQKLLSSLSRLRLLLFLTSSWDGIETELPLCAPSGSRRPAPVGTLASSPPPACPQIPVAFSAPPGPPDS